MNEKDLIKLIRTCKDSKVLRKYAKDVRPNIRRVLAKSKYIDKDTVNRLAMTQLEMFHILLDNINYVTIYTRSQ